MQKESRVKKTMLNAKINLICYFASFITAFFTRKILLDHLGTEFIGFTGTVGSLLSFLNLAELGIGTAIGYVLYKPIADGDKFKINEVISVLGYLYRIIGLAILSLGIIGSLFLPLIFPDTEIPLGVIYFAFYAYLAASMIGYFVNYRAALLSADQRNYIVTGYFQITTTSKVILQMVLAIYFKSFYIYLAVELIGGIINAIILNWKINQTYPWLKSEIKQGKQLLKKYPEIIKYTKQIFAHRVGGAIQGQLTPILIYSYVSLPMVAMYTNYTIITQKIESLVGAIINGADVAVGNLIAEGNKEKTYKVFKELFALRFFIASIITICTYKFVSTLICIWLGENYVLADNIDIIISILIGLNLIQGVLGQFCHGHGLFADVWSPYAETAIMVVCSLIGGHLYGLSGILCGSLISKVTIIHIWKPYYLFTKGFGTSVYKYWHLFTTHICATATALVITNCTYNILMDINNLTANNWIGLICCGFIFLTILTITSTVCYFITSSGFRDLSHRIIR